MLLRRPLGDLPARGQQRAHRCVIGSIAVATGRSTARSTPSAWSGCAVAPRRRPMGLQLRPRIGDPDRSRAGRAILGTDLANGRVRSSVAPDHIVSLAEIVTLPGFAQLTPENMLLVANAPAN